MKTVAIICEYNPLHLGHIKQFSYLRSLYGQDVRIVCLMSGQFVQRGEPAVFDKWVRARAAVDCGADVVLELPITAAVASAEGFASGAVEILTKLGGIDALCFGCETADRDALQRVAELLCSRDFDETIRQCLQSGQSYAAARQDAVERLGGCGSILSRPNDILAVEYCKALRRFRSDMEPLPIRREGDYHALIPDAENPSAGALRTMLDGGQWLSYVPQAAQTTFAQAPRYAMQNGERAVLARLRGMSEAEYAALPYGSEGLWRKLMFAGRSCGSVEEILHEVKSRRYARSRISRMILCAYLGIDEAALRQPIPYVRILAFSQVGRSYLRQARETGEIRLVNAGEPVLREPYFALERRAAALFALFGDPDAPLADTSEESSRVYQKK